MTNEKLEQLWTEALKAAEEYADLRVEPVADGNAVPAIVSALLVVAGELRRIRELLDAAYMDGWGS